MRLLLPLFVCAMICSSCVKAPVSAPPPLEVACRVERCARPVAPEIAPLDPDRHIGGPENVPALLRALEALRGYADQLAAALDCYEAQAAGGTSQ